MLVKPDATKNVRTIKTFETIILIPETQKSSVPLFIFPSWLSGLAADLVTCINQELRGLAEAGCTHVQIDEPVMMR